MSSFAHTAFRYMLPRPYACWASLLPSTWPEVGVGDSIHHDSHRQPAGILTRLDAHQAQMPRSSDSAQLSAGLHFGTSRAEVGICSLVMSNENNPREFPDTERRLRRSRELGLTIGLNGQCSGDSPQPYHMKVLPHASRPSNDE